MNENQPLLGRCSTQRLKYKQNDHRIGNVLYQQTREQQLRAKALFYNSRANGYFWKLNTSLILLFSQNSNVIALNLFMKDVYLLYFYKSTYTPIS